MTEDTYPEPTYSDLKRRIKAQRDYINHLEARLTAIEALAGTAERLQLERETWEAAHADTEEATR